MEVAVLGVKLSSLGSKLKVFNRGSKEFLHKG